MTSWTRAIAQSATLILALLYPLAAMPDATTSERIAAVRAFADKVLDKGRDRHSGRDTPLFVDGIEIETGAPATWLFEGERYIISNLASQQNLFRTLDLLSRLTGEDRYRDAALAAIRYHFDRLASDCGLLRWGGHQFIDLATLEPVGKFDADCHELKNSFPYYELMFEANEEAAARYLRAFWNAHVTDWQRLDMNRHGPYGKPMGALWDNEFDPAEPFFEGNGLTFINCGSDLIYAAGILHRYTGDEGALRWAKRLAQQYVRARHPETGLGVYQYSKPIRRMPPPEVMTESRHTWSTFGDRAENQFGQEFGDTAREGYALWGGRPGAIYSCNALIQLALAEQAGERGEALRDWTIDGMRAYAEHAYVPEHNHFRPMWADGTDLTGFTFPRFGYYGDAGVTLSPIAANPSFVAAYARAFRLSNDPALWQTVRDMARGHGLGDLGAAPAADPEPSLDTRAAAPELVFGLIEIQRIAPHPAYLALLERIGANIIEQQYHDGWFLPNPNRRHANFNELAPLALLAVEAAAQDRAGDIPAYVPSRGYIHGRFDGHGRTTDHGAIWSQVR